MHYSTTLFKFSLGKIQVCLSFIREKYGNSTGKVPSIY